MAISIVADRISDSLREKGLLSGRYYRKPQPHITLLNAEFLRQKMRYGLVLLITIFYWFCHEFLLLFTVTIIVFASDKLLRFFFYSLSPFGSLSQPFVFGCRLGEEHISSISGMSESEFEKDQSQEYFDASSILEDYGAIEFGSIPLAELECFLCPFHENNEMTPSANPGSIDGFYPFIDSFPLSNERS